MTRWTPGAKPDGPLGLWRLPDYVECTFDECFTGSGGKALFLDEAFDR
jgi:hypothetical protein